MEGFASLTERTTSEQEQPTNPSSGPLPGEVVHIDGTRVRVRLVSGVVGFVDTSNDSRIPSDLTVGRTGRFVLHHRGEDGEIELHLISIEEKDAPRSFESDVHRLQTALNHSHRAAVSHEQAAVPGVDEQRIQQWLQGVEQRLDQLRRNRAKRLDEEFYSGS